MHCVAVAEPTEPSDIKWENVDVSFWERLWRGLVVYAVIVVLMVVSFVVLYAIKNYQDSMPSAAECRLVDTAAYSPTSLPPTTDDQVVNCFCQRQSYSDLLNDQTLNDFCTDYIRTAAIGAFLTFLVSLFVATVNVFLRLTMKGLSRFARYANVTLEARSVLTKIAVVVIVNSGLLILIANANFQKHAFFRWLTVSPAPHRSSTPTSSAWASTSSTGRTTTRAATGTSRWVRRSR